MMMTSVERHAVRKLVRLIIFVLPWCQLGHAGEYRLPIITERHNLYGQSGLIKTPNYPALVSSAMPKEFIWTITVPSGHRINIQFIHLNIACAVAQLYYGKDYSRTHCGDDVVASFVIPERRTSIKLTCRLSGSCGHFLAMYEAFKTSIPQSVCESSNSFIFNGNCYQINKSPMFSWKSAESQCKNINYDLITITSYEENEIIAAKLNGTSAWIGLIRNANTKGTFLWKNGTSVVMTNWVSGKPNGFAGKNCTVLKSNATWVNTNCNDTEVGYICKKAINPLPSTCKDSFGIQNGGIWDNLLSASSSNAKHAKLHGPQSWRPDNLDVDGLWLQIMMPNKTLANIRGIATQGDPNNAGNFVKTFTLSFSQMEDDLIPYRNSYWIEQVFQGNNDNNNVMYNKINPVIIGWRLRIHPKTSSGATAMRFEIYGCFLNDTEVEKAPIGVQSGAVQDSQITSSTLSEGCNPRYARLHLDSSKYKNTWRTIVVDHAQWLQIKLKSAYHISGIATQAGNLFDQPTRKYYLSYIESTSLFVFYKHRGEIKYFLGNTDNTTVVQNTIVPGIFTKVVRIHPYEWTNGGMTLRVELYGHMSALPKGDLCSKSVGIAEGAIPASSINVSSSCKSLIQLPKLNVAGSSWCTLIARGGMLVKNWIKVKLNNLTKLTGVATQGASTSIGWVKKYRLEYSIDGTTFTAYTCKGDFKIFDGNYDNGTIIKQELSYPVYTRYVLLHPTQYHQIIALRMELYGCQVQEKDYPLCNSPMGLGSGFIPAWALKSNAKNDSRVKDVRLDTSNISSRAWFPTFETTQKWLQVDFGLPSNITGIATMGTTQNSYKLESYQLEYRMNRDDRPKNYSTGASIMVFKGNENGNMITKHHLVPSIFAQFIKIVHWQTKISLKVEFYGCGNAYTGSVKRREKCNVSAGIEDGAFLIPSFKASSVRRPVHFSWKSVGLSQSPYVWKPRYQNTYQWIEIHFSSLHNIAAIKTEGNDLDMEWISSFMLKYKMDGQSFKTHKEIGQNTSTIFIGNSADRRTVENMLQPIITANTIRLLPVSWVKAIALRLELYGCRLLRRNLGCDQALRIGEPDASVNISVSSSMTIYFEPWQGRLHFVNSRRPFWSPLETDPNPWLQVDLGKLLNLTGVATQGAGSTSLLIDGNSFVKSYILAFAEDDGVFTKYVENENTRVFFGNTDSDSIVRRYFASRVQAKYSRLHPLTWNNAVALRMEFYGCGNEHSKWVTQNHQVVRIGCFSSIKQFLPGEKYSSKQTNGFEFCSKKAVMERWSSFAVLQSKYQCHKGPDNNDIQQAEHSYLCQNWTGGGQSGSSDFFIVIAHGNFSTWSHWSNCTESRGIGEKYRSRNCTNPAPLNGGKDCIGPFHETTSCNITKPAEWSNWGPCSTFCGPGVQNRTRSSNYAISNNNSNDIEFKQCNNSECFVLRNWTACAIVNNKCEKARASRKTDCTDPISGKKCYGCIKEIKSCNTSTMVIRYGNWSSCSKTCGEGRKNKKKYCTFYYSSFVDGSNVSSSKTFHISKSCNIRRCPVNGGWGPWSSSLCSQPCGNGTKTRQRQCNRPSPAHGGRNCEGPGTQRLECKLKECPVNGSYTTWGNWSRCSATCGNGTQVRTRNCTNPPPQHGGTCNGDASQVRICLMTICAIPINGGFSSWGNWSLCTLTCGNGTQQRTRNCSNPTPTNGGRNCTGRYTERQNCNTIPCPQIDGNFTAWSSWSTCTLTCGNGTQQRKRTCTNPKPQNGGVNCTGLYRETQNCNTQSCPTHRVDGGFTSWSQWSTCTVTCGSGIQKRMRTCTNPWPANGGSNCTGRFTEMRSCNTRHCPINGNWTDWSDWSYCNKPCGTGDEFKVRTCSNPPAQYGGEDCVGPINKSRTCNPNPCPAAEVSVVARFTKEAWNDDLENLQSQASRALKEKMWANIRALYRNDPSVTGIIVHSFRHGSVIANFSIQYQTLNSLKLLTLKDTMQVKGVLSDMPIKMVNISSNKVPTSSPTFTEAKNISSTSLHLKWLPVSSSDLHGLSLSSYIIFYREKSQQYTVDKLKSVRPQDTSTVIDGLLKYTDYSLRILAATANGNGIPSDPLDVKTDEDVPSQSPPNFQVVSKNSTYIAVLWNPINPAYHHGIFRGYNLTLTNQKTGKQIALIYSKEKLSSLFNGLDEYTYYDIRVCGFTSKGCGSQSVLIVRTDEDKPSSSPPSTKVLDFISTSSMKLSWQPIPEDDVNGVLKGFRIKYTILKTSGNPLENAKPMIMTVEPHATSVILENLTSYSAYEILLSAFTSAGDGPTSIVVGETCRCPKFMPTNYWPHKPYLTRFKNRTIGGIFPRIIDSMVVSVCGSCRNGHGKTVVDFDYDGRKQPSMKPGLIPMIGGLDQGTGLSFPVNGNKDMTNVYGEYPFVPLVQSPGVVFLAAKELPGSHVQNLFNSLINCAPLIAMSFLIAYLAGITMWVLDLKSSQAFPTSFLQGAPEGLWWAYITMTTVGYGDRVPKSFLARTFAILWTLYGIVIASMVTSSMTSSLTAVIIHPDKKIYGTKIAAVHKSCEHRLGILMNGIFDENKVYHNLEEVLQALNRREVEGALVDTYVAESETSLFKNSQIKITKTIGRSFGYGFALSGDAVRLENEFRNYYMVNERNILNIIGENVQSGSLKLNSGHSEEDAPVNIFDSSLVIYQQTLAVLGCLLFCAICIGLIWQLYYKKKQLENKVKHINDANITQRKCQKFITEARKLVDEFCRSTRQILTEMKHRHALEQHLIVMKKHQQYRHLKKFLERYRE